MKGIVLNGGHGTRLKPLTFSKPKSLIPIANIPISEYCFNSLKKAGITEIASVVGSNTKEVEKYYGNGEKFGLKINHIYQDEPKGISHAIGLCKDFVKGEKFVVFLGDNILLKNISDYVVDFNKSDDAAKILLCEVQNPVQFGIADIDKNGRIKKIIEKPKKPPTNLAVIGVYFLTPSIFDIIQKLKPSWRNELEITDALQMLLESGQKISYDVITSYWKDTGTFNDILETNKAILSDISSYLDEEKIKDMKIEGNIMIGNHTQIEKDVKIEGPVIIGKNCLISNNVNIGPNTSIGNNVKLKNCTIKNSIIMENCEINYNTEFKNSIISSNSQIIQSKEKSHTCILGENSKIN